jgi:hypothetical protein
VTGELTIFYYMTQLISQQICAFSDIFNHVVYTYTLWKAYISPISVCVVCCMCCVLHVFVCVCVC